jgi:hypothetical protein
MTILRTQSACRLSSIAQNFCRAVFNHVPYSGIDEFPAAKQEAFDRLTPQERDELAMEQLEFEKEQIAVFSGAAARSHGGVFHEIAPAFPVLSKFQSVLASIESRARQRVIERFTEEERLQIAREEVEYARAFDKFQNDVQILNSKPGQAKIYLPRPPVKGPMLERFEREMRKCMERR